VKELIESVLGLLFWMCAFTVAYVYAGFPILLALLAKWFPNVPERRRDSTPSVSLLISAFNESSTISAKIENSLTLAYPRDLLEIIVVSDCSNDGTDEIVRGFEQQGVRLIRNNQRMGKSAALNLAVPLTKGEILVFSDANAMYQRDAIRELSLHFASLSVGYVVGNARYRDKSAAEPSAEAEGLYWKLETWIKRKESMFASVVGGDGAMYAIRRGLYSPLRPTDINDFMNPLQIIDRGYRGIFEPNAICYEDTAESFEREYRRKVRIVSRSLNALRRVPGVLNPLRNTRHWFLLVSHKFLRWLAPFFLLVLFANPLILENSAFYRAAFLVQAAFYSLALMAWVVPSLRVAWKPFSLAYYFCLVNLASLVGCVKCIHGNLSATWTPPRQSLRSKA